MADFLDEMIKEEAGEVQPPTETPPKPEPAPVEPQEVEPAPTPEPVHPVQEDRSVPLPTFLDLRDRLKEAERERDRLRTQTAPKHDDAPDPIDDPQGYAAYNRSQFEEALTKQRFEISDVIAKQTHGEDKVKEAMDWAQQRAASDPAFAVAYMREQHPIDWIVRQHKRDGLLSQIGDVSSVDDWFTQEATKRGYIPAPAPTAVVPAAMPTAIAQPAAKPAPPRSIASDAPASGVVTHGGESSDFAALFKR